MYKLYYIEKTAVAYCNFSAYQQYYLSTLLGETPNRILKTFEKYWEELNPDSKQISVKFIFVHLTNFIE